jgi:4-amino-4-deoxy-L-arabinose transferase-like glycosyltransferase
MPQLLFGRWYAIALPISLLLLAGYLRIGGLARDQRLHPDEALYGDLARRIGVWGDWQLTAVPVDKPPLFFFTSALSYRFVGVSEFSTRWPNALASLLLIALTMRLAWRLAAKCDSHNPWLGYAIAIGTGFFLSLSPFEVAFALSGFTDTQAILYLILSLVMSLERRWVVAGLTFGLSLAVKPLGVWFLPTIGLWMIFLRPSKQQWLYWGAGFGAVMVLVMLWDALSGVGSFWALGGQHYQGGRWVEPALWDERIATWANLGRYLWPHALLGLVTLLGLWWAQRYTQWVHLHRIVAANLLLYAVCHVVLNFQLFEQYLLPFAPFIALWTAFGLVYLWRLHHYMALGLLGLTLALGGPILRDSHNGRLPIASDQGQHQGIDRLAEAMNRHFTGQIFYEHWLGWELRYYLGAKPQVILLYFETPADLIAYAREELLRIEVARYWVGPVGQVEGWVTQIRAAGFQADLAYADGRYRIYALTWPKDE